MNAPAYTVLLPGRWPSPKIDPTRLAATMSACVVGTL
jgi:hypothetical protein